MGITFDKEQKGFTFDFGHDVNIKLIGSDTCTSEPILILM